MLVVPPEFNRNSNTVTSLMGPEQSGLWLLKWMQLQLDLDSYENKTLLDFGCGVRFTQAIINTGFTIGHYSGVDVSRSLIEFLQGAVNDSRFEFGFLDAYHPLFNPAGERLQKDIELPISKHAFDVVCMFSVITHQYPEDCRAIFSILRRYVVPKGRLYFTCFLDETIESFEDRSPNQNAGKVFYNPDYLNKIVTLCGWRPVRVAPSVGPLAGESYVYAPV
jgi:SAM-dependent methyltransferase